MIRVENLVKYYGKDIFKISLYVSSKIGTLLVQLIMFISIHHMEHLKPLTSTLG
ncbi:hypothetical protein HS5_16300 [Acidianus sp. HS-5]|nr:hypothetical protein HS5_16300 [Acidianus sp. HS-5]